MPRECLVYIKYKDGHAVIATYRLEGNKPFGYSEMKKWIMEDDSEVVDVNISKVPSHLKKALHEAIDADKS